jgi:hypothetical protein
MNLKYPRSKSRAALLGASGLIAAGAIAGTTVLSHAASPTPSAQVAPAQSATTAAAATETPEVAGAAETPEANEPALPGGGHNDTGSTADQQYDGVQ